MKKAHLILMGTALLSVVTLTGCDNKEKIRHATCSKTNLDIIQYWKLGDKSIDIKAANKIAKEYSCTYKDVTPEEKQARQDYLKNHPINATRINIFDSSVLQK